MLMIRPVTGMVLSMLTLSGSAVFAAPGDGYIWEYTSTMDMQGMQMKMPPTLRCMPIKEPHRTPPTQGDCTMDRLDTVGNTTSFEMSCGSPQKMKGSGTSIVTETTLEGTYTMVSADGEMKMRVLGERKGPCDTSAPQPAMGGVKGGMSMPPGMTQIPR